MFRELRPSLILFVVLMAITGFGYPMLVLYVGQNFFPGQANGSLINEQGKTIGSSLIGQNFVSPGYFHPRPSAAGIGYDGANSSGSNLGPTSAELLKVVSERVAALKTNTVLTAVPVDLVTSSASGLDPDISPASARFQAGRVAEARHMDVLKIETLIADHIQPPTFDFMGESRVNVLELNRALDQLAPPSASSP